MFIIYATLKIYVYLLTYLEKRCDDKSTREIH